MFSTLSIGCRTRATRLPSPFLLSPTQFPPSAPHTRMHRCPNRVSNPLPQYAINYAIVQSLINHHPPPTINHPPNTSYTLYPQHAPCAQPHLPISHIHPKSPHARPSPSPSTTQHSHTDQPRVAYSPSSSGASRRRAAYARRLKRTGFPSARSFVPCVERTSVD
jgi:hypothetical protein